MIHWNIPDKTEKTNWLFPIRIWTVNKIPSFYHLIWFLQECCDRYPTLLQKYLLKCSNVNKKDNCILLLKIQKSFWKAQDLQNFSHFSMPQSGEIYWKWVLKKKKNIIWILAVLREQEKNPSELFKDLLGIASLHCSFRSNVGSKTMDFLGPVFLKLNYHKILRMMKECSE